MNWSPLTQKHKILVSSEHTFNTDTLLLADFSSPSNNTVCADFGCGCGTIAVLWSIRYNPKKIFAVELQQQAVNQLKESISKNCITNIELLHADIKDYKLHFSCGSLDQVACNPPYKAHGAGVKNNIDNLRIARHEDELSLEELAVAVSYVLRFGGKFFICQRPERLTDAMNIFRKHSLEPKKLRLVQQNSSKQPSLFLLECRKGGKSGLNILPTLFIKENEEYSLEMKNIYGEYREANIAGEK